MVPWNLHVIPAVTNMAKGTMVVDEWINRDFEAERRTANAARLERERINREKWKAESEYWGEKTRQRRARYGR